MKAIKSIIEVYTPYWWASLTFNKNNMYEFKKTREWYFGKKAVVQLSDDEELKDLIDKYKDYTTNLNPIKEGGSLKFTKYCSFPKLFLKDSNVGLKRTIKENLATNIVIDGRAILNKKELQELKDVYLFGPEIQKTQYPSDTHYGFIVSVEHLNNIGTTLEDVQNVLNKKYLGRFITFDTPIQANCFVEILTTAKEKISSTEQLCKYLNSKFTQLEQKDTLLGLLSSTDVEHQKLGLNMVKMFDLSDCLYDVMETIATSSYELDGYLINSVNFKYLLGLFGGITYSYLRNHWNWEYSGSGEMKKALSALFNSDIVADEQRKKTWFKFLCLSGYEYTLSKNEQENFCYDKFDFSKWTEDMLDDDRKKIFDKFNMPYVCPEMKDNL